MEFKGERSPRELEPVADALWAAGLEDRILPQAFSRGPWRPLRWPPRTFAGACWRAVFPWTLDLPAQWIEAVEAGADGIITNRPGAPAAWGNTPNGNWTAGAI